MIRNYLIIIFFLIFVACTSNTISDYTSLKQKALEIPPDFELTPPVVGEEEVVETSPQFDTDDDIKTIIIQDMSSTDSNSSATSSLDEFIESNFNKDKKNEINQIISEESSQELMDELTIENNESEILMNDDLKIKNSSEININRGLKEDDFLEAISNTDDITALSEEDQLKPEIIDDTMYDDTTSFDDDDDINDLLNRVDKLLNSSSN